MARISNDAFEPFCPHFCLFIDIQPTVTDRQLNRNKKQPRHFVFCSISLYLFVPHPAGPAQFALISARGRGCEARVFAVKRDIAPGVWRARCLAHPIADVDRSNSVPRSVLRRRCPLHGSCLTKFLEAVARRRERISCPIFVGRT